MNDSQEELNRLMRIELQVTRDILSQFPTEELHLELAKKDRRKRERIQRDGRVRQGFLAKLLSRPSE